MKIQDKCMYRGIICICQKKINSVNSNVIILPSPLKPYVNHPKQTCTHAYTKTRTKTSIRYAKEKDREKRERKQGRRRDIDWEGEIRDRDRER